MSTVVLHQQTKNTKKKKKVSWAEGVEWKKGEEEKTRTRKAAFKHRRVGVKREKMVTHSKKAQAEHLIDKAALMYHYLIEPTVHERIAKICNEHLEAENSLKNSFIHLDMGQPDLADIKSIKSALSRFGVFKKTNNDAQEQEEKKTRNDDGRWDAWEKHVLDPHKVNEEVIPQAVFTLGSLLTILSKKDHFFYPKCCDLTTVESIENIRAIKMSDAGDMVKHLSNSEQKACMTLAHYGDPDDPASLLKQLLANWIFDKKEEGPPVGNVDKRSSRGSAASSLSDFSPSRKKMKSSVPVETENDPPACPAESRGESSMTKNDEH